MIEDVLNPEQLERQCDQENIVWRVAPLNDMKSMPKVNPPRIPELPKECAAILPQIPERTIPLLRRGVPIDLDTVDNLMSQLSTLALWTQYGDLISRLMKGTGFLQYSRIVRDWLVFDDNENFFLHLKFLRFRKVE